MKALDRLRHSAFLCLASFVVALPVAALTAFVIQINDEAVCEHVLYKIQFHQALPNKYTLKDSICIDLGRDTAPLTEAWVFFGSALTLFALWKDWQDPDQTY